MKILIPSIVILTIVLTASSFAQGISNEIDSIYNFRPSKLNRHEQESKGVVMDKFWNKIKSDTTKFLPMLREELQTNTHDPFFYFDGSSLLLSLTKNREDTILSIDAIAKCDVKDISRRMYVTILNKFAHQGFEVTKPAVKILDEENYHFFIPQHAFDFNQEYCLTYMLLPQGDKKYIDTLIVSFNNFSTSAQKSVITTLWFAATCKGDNFLKSIAINQTYDKEVSEYARKIMGYTICEDKIEIVKKMEKDVSFLDNLDESRKDPLSRFSDEAIEDLDLLTKIIRRNMKCN